MTLTTTKRGEVSAGEQLALTREGINFKTVGNEVRIFITVTNRSRRPAPPASLKLETAPLGAFVDWTPLREIPVPYLKPGESVTLETQAPRPRPQTLGGFSDVPPGKILTALDDDDRRRRGKFAWEQTVSQLRDRPGRRLKRGDLAPDIMEMLGHPNTHWAGNLNVFIGETSVERHRALELRVYPRRTNLVMFVLGSGCDAYSFDVDGQEHWLDGLYNMLAPAAQFADQKWIPLRKWVEFDRCSLILMAIIPPQGCGDGTLTVNVTQRSTGRTAKVEFGLSETATGPGCYALT